MSKSENRKPTFGLIVGNRGFFPDHLAATGRNDMIRAIEASGAEVVALTPEESKFGAVETYTEARKCADLFKSHREQIDGVVVTLPNFGDERAIADTLRLAALDVPVLVQATPDTPSQHEHSRPPRDSFCGKMSACNNLMQYGIPYSLTTLHTETPQSRLVQARPRLVYECLPRGARSKESTGRIARRPAAGFQHGEI